MDQYILSITPIINEILSLTKQGIVKWDTVGNDTYRCVAIKEEICLEISTYNALVQGGISIKLFSKNKLEFEYTPDLFNNNPKFDNLLSELYTEAEKRRVDEITSKFNALLSVFKNKESK